MAASVAPGQGRRLTGAQLQQQISTEFRAEQRSSGVAEVEDKEEVLLGEILVAQMMQGRKHAIDPNSLWYTKWDTLMTLLLLYTAVVTPFEIAFLDPPPPWTDGATALFVVNKLVDFCFIIDLVMNFFVAYFSQEESKWIYEPKKIRSRYLRSWCAIDFVSILPFDTVGLIAESDELSQLKILRIIRLLRLLKLLRILKASKIISRIQSRLGISTAGMKLINFMLAVVVMMHWTACAWNISPQIDAAEENWLDDMDMVPGSGTPGSSVFMRYALSFEFGMMTMVIGYGKIEPVSASEQIMGILILLINGSLYGYVIGEVCGIVEGMDPATQYFRERMDLLNGFMSEIGFPVLKRDRFREFFSNSQNRFRYEFYGELLSVMSPTMRGEICLHQHGAWMSKIPFFNCDDEDERLLFLTVVAQHLKPVAYASGDELVTEGESADQMYVVMRGIVGMFGRVKGQDTVIGEDLVLSKGMRDYRVTALTFVDAYELEGSVLKEIVESGKYPRTARSVRWYAIRLAFRQELAKLAALERMQNPNWKPMTREEIEAWKANQKAKGDEKSERVAGEGTEGGADRGVSTPSKYKSMFSVNEENFDERLKRIEMQFDVLVRDASKVLAAVA